jgi:imidazoleglycerol-phosphate dehydratase
MIYTKQRDTAETQISLSLEPHGEGRCEVLPGLGFFDHMLQLLVYYARFDLTGSVKGDTHIGSHHVIEDIGIVLGATLHDAWSDRAGLTRFGDVHQPMDGTLVQVVCDLSSRIHFVYNINSTAAEVEGTEMEVFREFFSALVQNARFTLHINELYADNRHHLIEAVFKGVGRALAAAMSPAEGLRSTKNVL